jgi:hypothetical protein
MAISALAGAKLFIATGANANSTPANAAAYAALTWTEVKEVESIGQYGDSSTEITFISLSDSRVRKLKGSRNAGNAEVVVANDPLDAGQLAVIAAEATKFTYNFKVEYLDKADANDTNSIDYFGAKVLGVAKNGGSADDVSKRTLTLGIDTGITEVPATVVP